MENPKRKTKKRKTKLWRTAVGLLLVWTGMGSIATAKGEPDVAQISAEYQQTVVYIHIIGTLFNGNKEEIEGSGFFVSPDGYILSASHLFPESYNYRELVIKVYRQVSMKTYDDWLSQPKKFEEPLIATWVDRDSEYDLALIKVPAPPTFKPTLFGDSSKSAIGSGTLIMGYPITGSLSISKDFLSAFSPVDYKWHTNTNINPGNSGGPVFDDSGAVVGIVFGRLESVSRKINGKKQKIPVTNVNLIIPFQYALAGILDKHLPKESLRQDKTAWFKPRQKTETIPVAFNVPANIRPPRAGFPDVFSNKGGGDISTPSSPQINQVQVDARPHHKIVSARYVPTVNNSSQRSVEITDEGKRALVEINAGYPEQFNKKIEGHLEVVQLERLKPLEMSYQVSKLKADHTLTPTTQEYELEFHPAPGYQFEKLRFVETSKNKGSDVAIILSPDKNKVTLRFSLTSGPVYDRYRGWLDGTLLTLQKPSEDQNP